MTFLNIIHMNGNGKFSEIVNKNDSFIFIIFIYTIHVQLYYV